MTRALLVGLCLVGHPLAAQDTSSVHVINDSVTFRFVEADLRGVVQVLARYLDRPVMVANVPAARVSLETPRPVPRTLVVPLLRGLLEANNLELVADSSYYQIAPATAPPNPAQAPPAPQETAEVHLYVIRLKHAAAADVATTLNLLFGTGGEFARGAALQPTLSDELRRNLVPPVSAAPSQGVSAAPGEQRSARLSGAVTIVPDERTNSLLIRGTQSDFDVLQEAVDQLDIRPLQVLIEVLIVEARRDRMFSLGADWLLASQPFNDVADSVSGAIAGGGLGDLVIRLMGLGHEQIAATLRAAASKGDVHILSRPVLLASNNTEARLLVGSQRPFVQVSRSLPTDTPTRDQVVQYRDVGTKLSIRPTINQDGYISLAIQQEMSAATSEVQFQAPVISTREAVTEVLVKDGQTIVLGGMRDRETDNVQIGVPILSHIPVIGGLFGSTDRHRSETELYLFLTPQILRTDADADSVTRARLPKEVKP